MSFMKSKGVSIKDGFPNPATDTTLGSLDLNNLLIKHPISTFFMRIASNDWAEQGIFEGDIVIIDRVLKPQQNDLVIWWQEESFMISPMNKVPLNTPVWGVVTSVIHQFRGREK